jgi:hypothetical protein
MAVPAKGRIEIIVNDSAASELLAADMEWGDAAVECAPKASECAAKLREDLRTELSRPTSP